MVMCLLPAAYAAGNNTIVINATKTQRPYIEKDISQILQSGGTLLFEYDFTAEESGITGACFVQNQAYSRYFPVCFDASSNELWYESNAKSGAGNGSVAAEPANSGGRYHVVSVLNIKAEGSTITTYVNGIRVRNAARCKITTSESTYPWEKLRVYKGSYARLTVLESAEFDYTPYSVDVAINGGHTAYLQTAVEGRADFTLSVDGKKYTAAELISAVSVPEGATVTLIRSGKALLGNETITSGTSLFVQSANKLQTVEYKIQTDAVPFTTNKYTVNYEAGSISKIPSGTDAATFISNISVADGFSVDGVYCGDEKVSTAIADTMVLRIKSENETVDYALYTDSTDAVLTSQSYTIDDENKKIYGVLKYTPSSKLIKHITAAEGTQIVGLYNNGSIYDGKIDRNGMVLRTVTNGSYTDWELKLTAFNAEVVTEEEGVILNGLYNKITDGVILVSGEILSAAEGASVTFADLYSEAGAALYLSGDGYIYSYGHRSEMKWTKKDYYAFTVITDTERAEAKVYINGELILDIITAKWFDIHKNPYCVKANFTDCDLQAAEVYSLDVLSEKKEVYPDNFKIVSEYYKIENDVVKMSGASCSVKDFTDRLTATNGATASVYKSGSLCADSDTLTEEMYIILKHGENEKRYEIEKISQGVAPIGKVNFYKNEKTEENNISSAFTTPVLPKNGQNITPELTAEDNLVISIRLSNYNSDSRAANVFAAAYNKDGGLERVLAITDVTLDAYTDGQEVSGTIVVSELTNIDAIKLYLWGDELIPISEGEIYISPDTSLLDEKIDSSVQNPAYRDEAPNIITSALVRPNYKGLIFEENGENDIQLMLRMNEAKLTDAISAYKVEVQIYDKNKNVILKSDADDITAEMTVTFSSKYLELGDYTLKASLIEKETLAETDYNLWTLRKRSGDITELDTYVDENGRFIKNGKPKFYIGMYGDTFKNTEQIEKLKNSGIDGIFLYQNSEIAKLTPDWNTWLDAIYESGMDFYASARVFHGRYDDESNFHLSEPSDEGEAVGNIVRALKNVPAVSGYYIGDEQSEELTDRLRWHQDIISTYDLEKPTAFVDLKKDKDVIFAHNASADIMGLDHYPVRYAENDPNINAISSYTKAMTDNFINKPVWMTLQSGNRGLWWDDNGTISADNPSQTPTEKQMRNMVMQAVVNGAQGIWWYSYASLMDEALDTRNVSEAVYSRIERVKDLDELLSRPLGVSKLFSGWGDIIMSDKDVPRVDFSGKNIEYTVRRYNGKTYILAVNTSIFDEEATFAVDGITSVKDIFTGEVYSLNSDGSFTAELENIGIAVFEIEHSDFKSHNSSVRNIAFHSGNESYIITNDAEGNMTVIATQNAGAIEYSFDISEKASLYFNEKSVLPTGTITGSGTFKVVAEDGSYTEYKVTVKK